MGITKKRELPLFYFVWTRRRNRHIYKDCRKAHGFNRESVKMRKRFTLSDGQKHKCVV